MGMLRGVLRTGVALKVIDIARREAAKPANQEKAKQLLAKVSNRGGGATRR